MSQPAADALLRAALKDLSRTMTRLPGREVRSGPHEVRELGPALVASLVRQGLGSGQVTDRLSLPMSNWTRPSSQIDLVVFDHNRRPEWVAELKAWDIGHQLFDLAKVCCLLNAGLRAGFLVCVARREQDFTRQPGGELFANTLGERRERDFAEIIATHAAEWRHHVGKNGPEPTSVPTRIATTSVASGLELCAYPGHAVRAARVEIVNSTPVALVAGSPVPGAR